MATRPRWKRIIVTVVVLALLLAIWCWWRGRPAQDEAMAAGLGTSYFHQDPHEADYFHDMDGGAAEVRYDQSEVRGRNTWMVWTGGNEAFWDYLANNSFGTFDMLKTISSYPCSPDQEQRAKQAEEELAGHAARADSGYEHLQGAYGEHGYATPPGSDDDGDQPAAAGAATGAGAATAAGAATGTGAVTGAGAATGAGAQPWKPQPGKAPYRYYNRATRFDWTGLINEPGFTQPTAPDAFGLCLDRNAGSQDPFEPKVYGHPSGVLGLRLYPNPAFKGEAKAKWMEAMKRDAFYLDSHYYSDRKLVRPYRVGMACSFCHVSPHPLHPPADPENPKFSELSGTIGAQYFWFGRIFGANVKPDNFVWDFLASQRPGAVDTSFIPSDNLDNPRAMNGIFNLAARLDNGKHLATETSTGGALRLPEVATWKPSYTFGVPHILWDGSDSVGVDAALTRVYINIGEYHQEWIRHISPIVGLGKQSPITVEALQENSTYWNSTQQRAGDLAHYLIKAGYPMHLAAAPGGAAYLKADPPTLDRGRVVFAETCARCHSSKLPPQPAPAGGAPRLGDPGCIGGRYGECFDAYWKWTETPQFKAAMTEIAKAPDFLDGNYLSTDARIPVTLLKTEICSSMASNAIAGHVWDNFSSQSYKDLPALGKVELYEPIEKKTVSWDLPGGGRGYQRVPSLISVWATAPYLHNNELGKFTGDPSIAGRMQAFDDAIHQLLWPDRRKPFWHATRQKTYVTVETSALPWILDAGARLVGLVKDGEINIGPIPQGTPINLIANINAGQNDPQVGVWTMLRSLKRVKDGLVEVQGKSDSEATERLKQLIPDLLALSTCPDFVVNRGHEFGAQLSDQDKEALIEYLKTL